MFILLAVLDFSISFVFIYCRQRIIMFLDRQDNRKQLEQAYRKELKDQINQKQSRVLVKGNQYHPQNQGFSLIANIEKSQLQRKKKSSQYYTQLREQIEEEKRIKNQIQAQKKRKQLQEENKIKQEQQKLQQRYEEEMRRQKKGKSNLTAQPVLQATPKPNKKNQAPKQEINLVTASNNKVSESENKREKIYSLHPLIKSTPYEYGFSQIEAPPPVSFYQSKNQNETLNYIPRNSYKNNYYKQLLGQRRRLQQETKEISELNRLFNVQRYRKKQESRELQELKNLQRMLDDKNADYLDLEPKQNRQIYDSGNLRATSKIVKSVAISHKSNKDEWRKLD